MARTDTDRIYETLLVTQARRGDARAGERLAARWYPRLLTAARRLLRDDDQARDAVQDAWAGICRGWVGLRDAERFPAWAYGVLRRKCADRIRQETKRRAHFSAPSDAADAAVPSSEMHLSDIERAFDTLPDAQRLCAIFYFAEGLSLRETAEAVGIPIGTAKSRIFHARKQLQAHLKGDSDDSI